MLKQPLRTRVLGGLLAAACLLAIHTPPAVAWPYSSSDSLIEQMAAANVTVIARWLEAERPPKNSTETNATGTTTFEIAQRIKGPSAIVTVNSRMTLRQFQAGKAGDEFLVLGGIREATVEWESAVKVTDVGLDYLLQAPTYGIPESDRLPYFLPFLEHADPLIADDAFNEIANAAYEDVAAVAGLLTRDKLRQWIDDPATPANRLGFYGAILGLCGNPSDAKTLETHIVEQTDEYRLGIDGMIGGYLLLTRDAGLAVIDREKLLNKQAPFSETFAAIQALRFMWTQGQDRISAERLRQSMRLLLDRPELADLVIADLARWQDWSVQRELMNLYSQAEFNSPSIQRAIVRYLLVSSSEVNDSGIAPAHAVAARKSLEELRQRDPKRVAEAERFFEQPAGCSGTQKPALKPQRTRHGKGGWRCSIELVPLGIPQCA